MPPLTVEDRLLIEALRIESVGISIE